MHRSVRAWPVVAAAVVLAAGGGCRSAASPPARGAAAGSSGDGGGERVLAFSVIIAGRHAGEAEIRIEPDGKRLGHSAYNDRGRGPDLRTELVLDRAGMPRRFRASGHDYLKAPVDERLDESGGTLTWQSTDEHGQAPSGSGLYLAEYRAPTRRSSGRCCALRITASRSCPPARHGSRTRPATTSRSPASSAGCSGSPSRA